MRLQVHKLCTRGASQLYSFPIKIIRIKKNNINLSHVLLSLGKLNLNKNIFIWLMQLYVK